MLLYGKLITLRPAVPADKDAVFQWLSHSDLTHTMLGPPLYPDNLPPTWEEFLEDHNESYFEGDPGFSGRCFIIEKEGISIGQINYNEIDPDTLETELDIWLAGSHVSGKGYGTDAFRTLCHFLHTVFHCRKIYIGPSARNTYAVSAYRKAGFVPTNDAPEWYVPDYSDALLMVWMPPGH